MNCPHCQAPLVADARFCPACGKATAPTESGSGWPPATGAPDLVGREIAGRYRIAKKLGEGGMGAVYRGEQMSLKRSVAVKLLRPELGSNQMILQRFNAEAQAVAKLSHPNTVNIFDFGQDADGTLFIAMEYIEGKSLREAIQQEGPFSVQRALAIALQVAASLSDAHSQGIVHRDLKPDNVMLQARGKQKDVVRVLDFGIAKLRDDNRATQAAMTQAGDMLGTPQYMAPEQIKGETIDGRTDVYALGCMIYEMVTARLPFEGTTIMAMLSKHLVEDPVPPTQRRPELELPPSVDQLVLGAMQKEPKDRPSTMDAFADMIGALFGQLPPDPNAGVNRSGAMSMQYGSVPGAAMTPPAHSAFRPPTQAPGGFAPPMGPPPMGSPPMGPPPGVPYAPPGATPNPAFAQVAPTAQIGGFTPPPPPATAAPTMVTRKSSRAPLFAVIGVLALGGAGVGAWAVLKGDDKKPSVAAGSGSGEVAKPTEPLAHEQGGPQVVATNDPWATEADPDRPASTQPTQPKQPKQPIIDSDDNEGPPPVSTNVGTAMVPIPKGASITPPAGFTNISNTPQGIVYTHAGTHETVAMAPLVAGTNDPAALAKRYEVDFQAKKETQESVLSAGANRTAFLFTSQTDAGPLVHIVVLYISSTYRVGVLYVAPAAVTQTAGFEERVDTFFASGVQLP